MVLHAQQNLQPDFGNRVCFVAADLVAFPFSNCFDGIFSTASFHWVRSHDALFRNLYEALRPAGWLHAQCGGGPNIRLLRQRVRAVSQTKEFSNWLGDFPEPWFFSDAESAAARLRAAGFENVETGLEDAAFVPRAAKNSRSISEFSFSIDISNGCRAKRFALLSCRS
jgi:SAM-dependent methyltransferase